MTNLARFLLIPGISILLSSHAFSIDFEDEYSEIEFVTPTKSTVSITNSPNFVTKLSGDDLNNLGIDSIPEALRLVPGMIVSDLHGSNTQVGYHGLAVSIPRRMEVLFNSSSIYRPGYAGIHWRRLPFWVQDIESIEIIRGSATSDFGSNAMTGAVNLIQKPIAIEDKAFGSLKAGSSDSSRLRGGFHFGDSTNHIYARVFREESSGYDFAERSSQYQNDFDGTGILFAGEHGLGGSKLFDWNIAYSDYTFTAPSYSFIGNSEITGEGDASEQTQDSVAEVRPADESNLHIVGKLSGSSNDSNWNTFVKYSEFKRDQSMLFCNIAGSFDPLLAELDASPNVHLDPVDFPLIFGSGLSTGVVQLDASIVNPLDDNDTRILTELGQRMRMLGPDTILEVLCGNSDISTSEQRASLGGAYVKELNAKIHLTSSLEYIYSEAESQHYFLGTASRNTVQLSSNVRYLPTNDMSINAGLMVEGDDYLDEFALSHRVNANYSVNNTLSVKATYSSSRRSPDIHETDRKWQIHVDYIGDTVDYLGQSEADVFRVVTSPEDLEPEKIESYELGVVYVSNTRRYVLDTKVFQENLSNLISEPLLYLDFNLTNNGEIDKRGVEMSYTGQHDTIKYGASYTYLDWKSDTAFESTLLARHIGSAWAILDLPWASNLGVSFSGHTGAKNRSYRLYGVHFGKDIQFGENDLEFQLGVKRYPKLTYTFTEFSAEVPAAIGYDNQNQYYMALNYSY